MENKPIRILLIEDNQDDARLLQEMLAGIKGTHFDIVCAGQLQAGLEHLSAGGIDVVLLDIGLPDSQGIDTFIQAQTQAPGKPIVALTDLDDEALAIEAVRTGAQDYLIKRELSSSLLMRSIYCAIERKRTEEALKQDVERLKRNLDKTIITLASTVETRDPYSAEHQQHAAKLSCAIAREMCLSEEQIKGIHFAAIVHDIGKISIPAELLTKAGRLMEAEYHLIKSHPRTGYEILEGLGFPWPIPQIVLQHHERMNGSGYPQGLSGENIILEARILGVADVVEAIASRRSYRKALGINKSLKEIKSYRGRLYDPEVVDICLELFTEKGFKWDG